MLPEPKYLEIQIVLLIRRMRLLPTRYGGFLNCEGKLGVLSCYVDLQSRLQAISSTNPTDFLCPCSYSTRFLGSGHTPTPHGRALYGALVQSRVNDKFQDPVYLAIELVRAGVLHSGKFSNKTWSGGPNLGGESDKTNAMLVMRVLSIVPLTFKAEAWTGPVSRSLLVFNSFLRCLSRSLRALLEATTVNLLLKGDARRSREDYLEITLSLPFSRDTNTGMGVVWKGWCDACSHVGTQMGLGTSQELGGFVPSPSSSISATANLTSSSSSSPKEPSEVTISEEKKADLENVKKGVSDMLEGAFGNVRDVRNELARGVRFWDTVSYLSPA